LDACEKKKFEKKRNSIGEGASGEGRMENGEWRM
jgi:hypothetical protein